MSKKSQSLTAAELLSKLANDKDYQEKVAEKDRQRKERELSLKKDEQPLTADLKKINAKIDSVWDLVNTTDRYPELVPVLLRHLGRPYDDLNKEGIIRALAVVEAKDVAGPFLLDEFDRIDKTKIDLLWVIGNTMEVVISDRDVERVIKIVKDQSNVFARQPFVVALGKVRNDDAESTLIELLNDDEVVVQALEALSKYKSLKTKPAVEKLLDHKDRRIRLSARKTLKCIG